MPSIRGVPGREPRVQGTQEKKEGLEKIVSSFNLHLSSLGMEGFSQTSSAMNDGYEVEFRNHEKDEKRSFFCIDGVIIETRDYPTNGLIRSRQVTSFCADVNRRLRKLHTTDYSRDCYGNAMSFSNEAVSKLKRFVMNGYVDMDSGDGVTHESGGFSIDVGKSRVHFPNQYWGMSDQQLLAMLPMQPFYTPEKSLFNDVMHYVTNNGHSEISKHKICILLMKNRESFLKTYHSKLWEV